MENPAYKASFLRIFSSSLTARLNLEIDYMRFLTNRLTLVCIFVSGAVLSLSASSQGMTDMGAGAATTTAIPAGYVTGTPGAQDLSTSFHSPLGEFLGESENKGEKCIARVCQNCLTEHCRIQCWRLHCR